MVDKYKPDPITDVKDVGEAVQFMVQELEKIADFLDSVLTREVPELNKEPAKPRDRMIVAADGVLWNPGAGKGLYTYLNGEWYALAATQVETPPPPPPPPPDEEEPGEEEPPGPPGPLPPETGRAIATFHSMGLYWTPPSVPANDTAVLQYRKTGDTVWIRGHDMWYDARNNECRGSVMYLDSNTEYDFQFSLVLGTPIGAVRARTWNEVFPIGETVHIPPNQTTPLIITTGGTPTAYKLYTFAPGSTAKIDVGNSHDACVRISAPYVILRGIEITGAQRHAIRSFAGCHDVVVEHCDISNWGREDTVWTGKIGNRWKVQADGDSAFHAFEVSDMNRMVIQYNRIHSPRYGSFPWDFGHPKGGNGIYWHDSGHNHVIRWNSFIADLAQNPAKTDKFFMDAGFGNNNFSTTAGAPGNDSDVYGNYVWGCFDDGLECEGSQRNCRIWGNFLDMCSIGYGSTVVHNGPQYIFRNVHSRARLYWAIRTWDTDDRGYILKAATLANAGRGMRYFYHNTILQHPPSAGFSQTQGPSLGMFGVQQGVGMTHTKGRNNILHVWKSTSGSIAPTGTGEKVDVDYDLYNGQNQHSSGETNGIKAVPEYKSGHGPTFLGKYQLAAGSPGHDDGVIIPGFNDGYLGAGPDMGAHEEGMPDLVYGHLGDGKGAGEPP